MALSKLPKDPKKAANAARSPDATIEELECLATSEFSFVREYVARNSNVSSTILENLLLNILNSPSAFGWSQYFLALAIAQNAKSLPSTLEKLFSLIDLGKLDGSRSENELYERLAIAILAHANCPKPIAVKLLKAPKLSRRVRLKAAQSSKSQDVLKILKSDRSTKVSNAALTNLDNLKNQEFNQTN